MFVVQAFAERLHARGFPYVSILEGGMEALVEHLHQIKRCGRGRDSDEIFFLSVGGAPSEGKALREFQFGIYTVCGTG